MSHYCPVCGVTHTGPPHHHHHHAPSAPAGLSAGPALAGQASSREALASAEEEDEGEPAPSNPGQAGEARKTVGLLAAGPCCQGATAVFQENPNKLTGVSGQGESLAATNGPAQGRLTSPKLVATRAFELPVDPSLPDRLVSPEPANSKPADSGAVRSELAAGQSSSFLFHLPGLCCNLEVNHLRAQLAKIPGLGPVAFNLKDRVVTIEPGPAELAAITRALTQAGFEATLLTAAEPAPPADNPIPWKRYLVATGLAFLAEGLHWGGWPIFSVALIAVVSFCFSGFAVYQEGLISFWRLRLDMNALMTLAVTGAVLIGQVAEGAMVLALFSLAEALEDRSLRKARAAIASLLALTPDKATIRSADGQWREIRAEEAPVGTLVQLRPGEKLPLDGRVVAGYTAINQAPVTGESAPVDKGPGDQVFAGTINGPGSIEYVTTAVFQDSTMAKVASFVEASESQKAPVQRLVDKFAAYYTPTVFGLAFLVAIIPPLFYGQAWGPWAYKALVLLVISCPCALVISVPVTILCGLAAAAKKGLIIKGGAVLEAGRKLKILALDKTGTITTGQPRQTGFLALGKADPARVARLAASLAARSDHPVSRAIFESYPDKDRLLEAQDVLAIPGQGLGGRLEGQDYRLGSRRLLTDGQDEPELELAWRALTAQGQSGVLLLENGRPLGVFSVADSLKADSRKAIAELKSLGLKTVMLTGDGATVARAVAQESGVDSHYGELLPEDKARVIAELKKEGPVGMVGDGINDAPALVTADVGLAMAMMGTDVAIETASVAIMDDKLSKIADFIRLARAVWAIVVENFLVVFAVKLSFLALTMAGFTSMWMAIIADIGVCLVVVTNGLRALRK